ncbi:MAG TPA: FAD-dependent oxidoreductase [Solirubrobacteraceae bacterium]|nr:FAD-dependent oxidoreductase [Solirubrobacteraceae bacterium]
MPDRDVDVLIVGAGAAGSACAEALARDRSFSGSVLLVGREQDPPYERPPASKDYLRGETDRDGTYLHPADWYAAKGVELRSRTSVMKLDTAAKVAKLSSKEEVGYGACVLATGANVRRLRVPGAELEGIHYLRALGNADSIRADAAEASRVVLVGGSYIACEVAASLTALGKHCTMVMVEDAPLSTHFGEQVGAHVASLLRDRGVELVTADPLAAFVGDGRVASVETDSGRLVDADLVVMGTGAVPDVMLARSAGLTLGETGGVECSSTLATSADGVWCAGDACEYDSVLHGRRVRIEHWEVARAQGKAVAAAVAGRPADFVEVPYFWSDLADWLTLEYVGTASAWDQEIVRGSFDSGSFAVFYLADGRLVGALSAGRPEDLMQARRLLAEGGELGGRADVLPDLGADLSEL